MRRRLKHEAAIELREIADAFFRDVVADHPVALGVQLGHVDIGRIDAGRPVGDVAGLEKRLDQRAENVGRPLHLLADLDIRQRFREGGLNPRRVQPQFVVDSGFLVGRHQIEQQHLEDLRGPVLDLVALLGIKM